MVFWSKKDRSRQDGKYVPWDESDQLEARSDLDLDSVSDSVRLRKAGSMTFLASIVGQAARLTYLRAFKLGGHRRQRSTSASPFAERTGRPHQTPLPIGARARRASLPCLPSLPTVPTALNSNGQHIPSLSLARSLHTPPSSSSTTMVLGFGKSWSAKGKVGAFATFVVKAC